MCAAFSFVGADRRYLALSSQYIKAWIDTTLIIKNDFS